MLTLEIVYVGSGSLRLGFGGQEEAAIKKILENLKTKAGKVPQFGDSSMGFLPWTKKIHFINLGKNNNGFWLYNTPPLHKRIYWTGILEGEFHGWNEICGGGWFFCEFASTLANKRNFFRVQQL